MRGFGLVRRFGVVRRFGRVRPSIHVPCHHGEPRFEAYRVTAVTACTHLGCERIAAPAHVTTIPDTLANAHPLAPCPMPPHRSGMTIHVLERETVVGAPLGDVFPFFADAKNLERLTPPELRFRIVGDAPANVRAGTLIDYRLKLHGIPFGWRTLIESFEPGVAFVDLQIRGPYKLWRHTHRFEDLGRQTRMFDRVEYEVPFGPLGAIARAIFVTRQVGKIFDYRESAITALFGAAS